MRKTTIVGAAFAAAAIVSLSSALSASAVTMPVEGGPFSSITTKPDLNCSAELTGIVDAPQYRASANCVTAVADGTTRNLPADESLYWGYENDRTWTPVAQTNTGNGTFFDPYVVTTVAAGPLLEVTQTDTYVSGESSYATKISVRNTTAVALTPSSTESSTARRPNLGITPHAAKWQLAAGSRFAAEHSALRQVHGGKT